MAFALGPKALAAGYRLVSYESIGSTSSEALAAAQRGDEGRFWFVAREQTAGHGRRGRAWQTPKGNLAASLLMREADLGSVAATLGFAVGLALVTAIRAEAGDAKVDLKLKWPNDLLCDGAKVAGILLEAATVAGGTRAVVIGIGVNLREAPMDVPYPATTLADCGIDTDAEALLRTLAETWVDLAAAWKADTGFYAIRERWLAHATGIGGPIAVTIGAETVSGTFETIDHEGRLVVRAGDGSALQISAGDVQFGNAATARH